MQDYHNLLQDYNTSLLSFAKRWKTTLNEQSALASYHTTKRAQRQTIGTSDQLASSVETRYKAIEDLIKELRKEVHRFYVNRSVGKSAKHNRSDSLKEAFKTARAPVKTLSDKLDQLQSKEEKARDALHEAKVECEKIQYGPPTSEKKVDHAKRKQEEKQKEFDSIKTKIDQTKIELKQANANYRQQAMPIFEQCQVIEEKRLNLIRQTLIQFLQVIHPDDYSTKIDAIYDDVQEKIEKEQNTTTDLKFWAKTYGVNRLSPSVNTTTCADAQSITTSHEDLTEDADTTITDPKTTTTS